MASVYLGKSNLNSVNPRDEEFDFYVEIFKSLPDTVTSISLNLSCNDLSYKRLSSLLEVVEEFELRSLHLDLASTGLDRESLEYLTDWFECHIFVEEALHLDLSV